MGNKIKLALFISGRGSNMTSIIEACRGESYPAEIDLVLSNNPNAPGLERAKSEGISTEIVDHKNFKGRQAFEDEIQNRLNNYNIDLICLAGFMRVLTDHFVNQWPMRILNIHPSLLPKYKGLHPQQQALDANDTISGCTVHYVIPELDSGPIIIQETVPILDGDNVETLSKRILETEHLTYPKAIKIAAESLLKKRHASY